MTTWASDVRTIGIRELKTHASRILRGVVDQGETVEITHRGRTIARIVPVAPSATARAEEDAVWSDLDRVAAEVAARWPSDATAVDAVREGRREL
ncbi:MAG: type II toxin-antitoxin system Phd/YefM family antitoxin [Dehalococcoidia bacterium]